jgi:hypothetical protein
MDHPTTITTGPLPKKWTIYIDKHCENHISFCNSLFNSTLLVRVGYCLVGIAFVLGIYTLHNRLLKKKLKEKKRLGYKYHETILFITKFLLLLGIYFIYFDVANANTLSLVTLIVAMILVLPIMAFAMFRYWYQYRRKVDMVKDDNDNRLIVAGDVYQDFTRPSIRVFAIGLTQLILLTIYYSAVTDTINDDLPINGTPHKTMYPTYVLSSVLNCCYAIGVKDIFENTYYQTRFWLEVFFLNGRKAVARPVYIICPKTIENELKQKYHSDSFIKVPKIALLIRMILSFIVNMVGALFITTIMPLHLALADSPTDFVLKATAIYFIFDLDNLDETIMFWLKAEAPRTTDSVKIDGNRFEPNILSEEDDMGIEIRHYPRYSHVEFDTHSSMKIVMKGRKPLQKSHTITQAKVNNSQKFQVVSIKQPVEEIMINQQRADDDNDDGDYVAAVSYNHPHITWETNEQVVAVANLLHRNFDCTLFNPTATMSEILCHANLELQNELQDRGFGSGSVVNSGLSSSSSTVEGEQLVVFAKYNNSNINSSTSGSVCSGGEVWIYLDNDDAKVQELLATSSATAAAAATAAADDIENDDIENDDDDQLDHNNDDIRYKKIGVTKNIVSRYNERRNNFCSSSDHIMMHDDNTLDLLTQMSIVPRNNSDDEYNDNDKMDVL